MGLTFPTARDDNSSGCFHNLSRSRLADHDPVFMTYYYGTVAVLTVMNLVGNSIVLVTFYRHHDLRTPRNSFICSLASSDILLGLLYPLYSIAHIDIPIIRSTLGQWWVCLVTVTLVTSFESLSSYNLAAIAVSRLVIIINPLRYRVYLTTSNCLAMVAVVWFTCFSSCATVYLTQPEPTRYCNICRYELIFPANIMLFLTIFQFAIPLSIIVPAYIYMAYTARRLKRHVAKRCNPADSGSPSSIMASIWYDNKSFAVVSGLLGCFTLSWIPFIIYSFIVIIGNVTVAQDEYFSATVRICLYVNFAINVFIYAGRMADFKFHLRRDLRRIPFCAHLIAPASVPGLTDADFEQLRASREKRLDVTFQDSEVHGNSQNPIPTCDPDTTASEVTHATNGTASIVNSVDKEGKVNGEGMVQKVSSDGTVRCNGAVHHISADNNDDKIHHNDAVHNDDKVRIDGTVHRHEAVQKDRIVCKNCTVHRIGSVRTDDTANSGTIVYGLVKDDSVDSESKVHKDSSVHTGSAAHRPIKGHIQIHSNSTVHGLGTVHTGSTAHTDFKVHIDSVVHGHARVQSNRTAHGHGRAHGKSAVHTDDEGGKQLESQKKMTQTQLG